jgi:NAD(P)-dependent dehydrogenase (short-subunit alcohol dehydrogenase family)
MSGGRTYVVTGCASGIGGAAFELLEEEGARVIGVDRRDAEVVADLSTAEGRRQMQVEVERACGGTLDGAVACAGVGGGEGDPATIVRVNYFGALASLAGLRPLLARSPAPRAATVASIALLSGGDPTVFEACVAGDEEAAAAAAPAAGGPGTYGAAKRALARWVRHSAPTAEWAGAHIPLNAVAPGRIETPMSRYIAQSKEILEANRRDYPQPLGDFGKPRDVASLLAWLVSAANGFTTGQVIFVDGGHETFARGADIWQ